MKNFHDLVHALQVTEERYSKDIDAGVKKQVPPLLGTSLTNLYNEIKSQVSNESKFHSGVLVTTYRDLCQQLDTLNKDIKVNKTKWLDQYNKLVREVEQKRTAHTKAKNVYETSVDKAESAVANFRSGRSQVGNDKQVKKLEEAMHSASKDLEKNHTAYVRAVVECQTTQAKFEADTEKLLLDAEELETRRLATYQAIMARFVDVQKQLRDNNNTICDSLSTVCSNVNPAQDILNFIQDTYTGEPLEAHAVYEPKNSEVIPHYGDVGRLTDSQQHIVTTQANHRRLMAQSPHQPAGYPIQGTAAPSSSGINTSFIGSTNSAFTATTPGAGVGSNSTVSATGPQADPVPNQQPVQTQSAQLQCTALYDFMGQEPGDLSFVTNDVVELLTCDPEEDWWTGQTKNGASGAFPKSYVSAPVAIGQTPMVTPPTNPMATAQATTPTASSTPSGVPLFRCRAEFDFEGQEADELTLKSGDVLEVYNLVEDWYEGVDPSGKRGIFPANHVVKID
jgi:hypothetical protein